jgi:hypothetical protein
VSRQAINLGAALDDGTGEDIRAGGTKINANFVDLYGLPSATSTVNAGSDAFTGTVPARITAAGAAALAAGKPYCFIPLVAWDGTLMLPYDATQVTVDPRIVLYREGGPPPTFALDPVAYGAAWNDSTDDYPALAAVAAAINASSDVNGVRSMYVPPGRGRCSKPVVITVSGFRLIGNGQGINTQSIGVKAGASTVVGTSQGGPTFLVTARGATVGGLVPALVGTGNAWNAPDESRWFNLRDLPLLDMNGLAALTVECFYQSSFASYPSVALCASSGRWMPSDPTTSAFILYSANGAAAFTINLATSGVVTISGGTIADNTVHHVAASYDGATVRLFVDGTMVASHAGTGTLVQATMEHVTLGAPLTSPAEGTLSNSYVGPRGTIDSLRISNSAKYTANFTAPNAKLTNDGNTLALMNFDQQYGPATRVLTKNGDAWAVQRRNEALANPTYDFSADGVTFDSATNGAATHIFLHSGVQFWKINNCYFVHHRIPVSALVGNCFKWSIKDSAFHATGIGTTRFGPCFGPFAALGKLDTVWFWGHPVPLITEVGGIQLDNVFFQFEADSLSGPLLMDLNSANNVHSLTNVQCNTEAGAAAGFRASVMLAGVGLHQCGAHLVSCGIETVNGAPHVLADSIDTLVAEACNFIVPGAPAASVAVRQGTAPNQPFSFRNCFQSGTWIPWSATAGDAVVGRLGKLPALAFSATPVFDASVRDSFEMAALTANVTSSTLINVTPGQRLTWKLTQDGTGGRTFVWPTNVKGAMTISAGANTASSQEFEVGLDGNAYAISPGVTGM